MLLLKVIFGPNAVQPVIDAVEAIAPPAATTGVKAWIRRYLKGEIALVGTVATLSLAYLPAGGTAFHYASIIVAAVTIIGVVEARNGICWWHSKLGTSTSSNISDLMPGIKPMCVGSTRRGMMRTR